MTSSALKTILKSSTTIFFLAMLVTSPGITFGNNSENVAILLPLKINSLTDTDVLRSEADSLMEQAADDHGLLMVPREKAAAGLAYRSWPPDLKDVLPLLPGDHSEYIAIGSLNRFGTKLSLDITVHDQKDPASTRYFFKELDSSEDLAPAINDLLEQIKAFANRHLYIATVTISGNKRIDSGAIRRNISSSAGDLFKVASLRKDLKQIYKMGYFSDVKISSKESPRGHEITFTVVEKSIINKVIITGQDKIKEDEIREVIKVKSHSIINDTEIRNSITNIRNLYRKEGYYNCQVEVKKTDTKKGRVDLTFSINEGPKVFIKEIFITGNQAFDDKKIKKTITTSEKGWFSFITDSGLLDKEKLEHDATRITAFYHNNGYVEAKVGEPEIVQEDEWFYVYFNVEEGDRYKCGSIDFSGDLIDNKDVLRKFVKVDREEFFSRKVLREDVLRLTDYYAEKGYAFAEATPDTSKDRIEKKVDLTFHISKGQLIHINRIIIKGNSRTRDKVIRREVMLKEGGLFDANKLKKSHERLTRISFFEDINISPESTLDDDLLDLVVEVKEKPTGKFSVGAGYSTVDKMTFMGEVSEDNLFGRGQRLSAKANLSSNSTRFSIDFTEPHIFDTKLLMGFSLYNWEREYDDYTKESRGGSIRFGYPIWEKWRLNTSYGFDDTELKDVDMATASQEIIDSLDFHVTSAVMLGFSRDTRNRMYAPSKGSRNIITVKYAGGPLGGDNSFTKLEASTSWYFPVTKNTTFHPRLAAGYIAGNNTGHLPVYEKFYLGGLSSIRAFDNGQISPIDEPSGDRIGGNKMWYSNIEYIFPLLKEHGLQGVIFYDIGNVYALEEGWDINNVKNSAGAGFRWMSPIGPLRLEWGYNLNQKDDEDLSNWEFSIGGTF